MNEIPGFVGLGVLLIGLFTWLRADQGAFRREVREELVKLNQGHADLRERMARLEGLLDGLREAVAGR